MSGINLSNVDPAQLKADAANIVNALDEALAFAQKYDSVLPTNVVTGIDDLKVFVDLVQKLVG